MAARIVDAAAAENSAAENADARRDGGTGLGSVGLVVGATVGFRLGGMLSFYVAAEDYIYGTTFVEAGTLEEKSTQHDVQLALGLGVPLNR